ncbi:hypothetical protein [Saccharothrix saharensis]|uniref:hypothetical protein n=1 Tax=Saccharothrix saharensis TaxID=571190 RepID=UPI001151F160|nr:hypothetical protein [Saccharothrix saharensis]
MRLEVDLARIPLAPTAKIAGRTLGIDATALAVGGVAGDDRLRFADRARRSQRRATPWNRPDREHGPVALLGFVPVQRGDPASMSDGMSRAAVPVLSEPAGPMRG